MKWRSLEEKDAGAETRTLREIFAERRDRIAQYVPVETLALHARIVAELRAQGLAAKSLAVGARMPSLPFPITTEQ